MKQEERTELQAVRFSLANVEGGRTENTFVYSVKPPCIKGNRRWATVY